MSGADSVDLIGPQDMHFRARYQKHEGAMEPGSKGLHDAHWTASRTAVVVCDLWDSHWCQSAVSRLQELVPRVERFLSIARDNGMFIVHSPSETLDQYTNHPARLRAQAALRGRPPLPAPPGWWKRNPEREPPLPVDDSDGGCPCTPVCTSRKAFTQQSVDISIGPKDVLSADEHEVRALFDLHEIKHVLVLGVHLNMCVLGRPIGIRRWVELGQEVMLLRDLTDVLYNPRSHPFIPLDKALNLVIDHVETYLCPTVSSKDIICALQT